MSSSLVGRRERGDGVESSDLDVVLVSATGEGEEAGGAKGVGEGIGMCPAEIERGKRFSR